MELKPPMSYEEQLNKLIEHGIVVDDRKVGIIRAKTPNNMQRRDDTGSCKVWSGLGYSYGCREAGG